METITCIRYFKKSGEFVVTTKSQIDGRYRKTHANNLTALEKEWASNSKYRFQDDICACWMN